MKFLNDFDWNVSDDIPEEYLDNPNVKRLNYYNLPIIDNLVVLFKALNLTLNDVKMLFYSNNRRAFLYRNVEISKKNGGIRVLNVPNDKLKSIQSAINRVILSKFNISRYATGFVKGKGICDNAIPHIKAKTLMKIDIKDFFPSINFYQVFKQFLFFGYGKKVSNVLARICVDANMKLPQGAPTSPALSNLICLKLDARISAYCEKKSLIFTRYADDITISSNSKLSKNEILKIKNIISVILLDEGFVMNQQKFHYFYQGSRFLITGIVANEKISVPKEKIREIDNAIRYINKYGLEDHMKHIKCLNDNYIGHLYGLASFIYMIDKEKGIYYLNQLNNLNLRSTHGLSKLVR